MTRRFAGLLMTLTIGAGSHGALGQEQWSTADDVNYSVTIEYIAHAAFQITSPDGAQLLIDPYGSREWIGYDFPSGVKADTVLITHPHYDHDGGVSRGHAAPWPGSAKVLRNPGSYVARDIEIQGVAGQHADPYGEEFGQTNTIWILNVGGLRIAHIGDNGPISDDAAEKIGEVDILMMPIDSQHHILKADEIRAILQQLQPSVIIPMHYRLEDLEPEEDEPDDLGDLDGWLEGHHNVRRLGSHRLVISPDDLPESEQIIVFRHSPLVTRPGT